MSDTFAHYAVIDRPLTPAAAMEQAMRSTYTIRFAPPIASFILSYTDRDGAEDWVITASNIEPLIEGCRGEPVTLLPAMREVAPWWELMAREAA